MTWYESTLRIFENDEDDHDPEEYEADMMEINREGNRDYPNILDTPNLVVQIGPLNNPHEKPTLWIYFWKEES